MIDFVCCTCSDGEYVVNKEDLPRRLPIRREAKFDTSQAVRTRQVGSKFREIPPNVLPDIGFYDRIDTLKSVAPSFFLWSSAFSTIICSANGFGQAGMTNTCFWPMIPTQRNVEVGAVGIRVLDTNRSTEATVR